MSVDPADLVSSLARHLHNAGLGHYAPDTIAPASLPIPLLAVGRLPQAPVSATAISHYMTVPDSETVTSTPLHLVQLLSREPDHLSVLRRERALIAFLHSMLPGAWPGGIAPLSVTLSSAAPASPDEGFRAWTKAANFAIRLNPGDES